MNTYTFSPKYPNDVKKKRYFDFVNVLQSGETVLSSTISSVPVNLATNNTNVGTKVMFDVAGGSPRDKIIITVTATGTLGTVCEVQGTMDVLLPL